MYSIPAYALRFAAHCRSRLQYTGLAAADGARAPLERPRMWMRVTPRHERHAAFCEAMRAIRGRS